MKPIRNDLWLTSYKCIQPYISHWWIQSIPSLNKNQFGFTLIYIKSIAEARNIRVNSIKFNHFLIDWPAYIGGIRRVYISYDKLSEHGVLFYATYVVISWWTVDLWNVKVFIFVTDRLRHCSKNGVDLWCL